MKKKSSPKEKNNLLSDPLLLLLSSVLALLPVIMVPFEADVYALPKVTFLYISSLALVFFYIIRVTRVKKFVFYRSTLDLPVIATLVYAAASLLFSREPLLGLVGKYGWYETLPALLCYAIIYFLSVQLVRDDERLERMLKVLSLGFIPVILYALVQSAGLEFPNIPLLKVGVRSSLANPLFLGAYLVIMLPLLFSLAKNAREENWRLLIWALVPTGATILLLSKFRGAWFGLAISILVIGIVWWRSRAVQTKNWRRPRTTGPRATKVKNRRALIAVIAVVVVIISLALLVSPERTGKQLNAMFTLSERSAEARIETWKASLAMISDRPLSGFGLEQMGYWFPAYKTPRHATIEPRTVEDHAHNDLLQAAVTMGIPGLLLYIWMFTMAILTLLKERETSSYAMGLFAAITGYVIQAQVGIPAVFISPVIWALLGISMGVTQHGRRVEVAFPRWFKPQVAIYIIGVAFAGLSLFALKPIIADIHIYKGQRIANTSFNRALPEFETAIRLYPYQTAYARAASEFYLDYANSPQNSIFAQRASLIAEQGLHYNKRDFELAYMVGTANLRSYKFTENDMALSKAERYFGQVEKLWPSLLLVKEGLFEVAFEKGDMKEAAVRAEELVRMGEEDPKAYYVLATEAQKKGEHKKAERYFKKMEELRTKSPQGM